MTELAMLHGNALAMRVIEQALESMPDPSRRWRYAYRKLESAYLYLARRGEHLGREFCEAAEKKIGATERSFNGKDRGAIDAG